MNHQETKALKNPELVAAMRAMVQQEDAQARSRVAAALMHAQLLSPVQHQTVLTEQSGPVNRVKFEEIENTAGEHYYLAFTDMEEYGKWNRNGKHSQALVMTAEDFGSILIRQVNDLKGFVINPFTENISISKELLLSLLKQKEAKAKASARQGN